MYSLLYLLNLQCSCTTYGGFLVEIPLSVEAFGVVRLVALLAVHLLLVDLAASVARGASGAEPGQTRDVVQTYGELLQAIGVVRLATQRAVQKRLLAGTAAQKANRLHRERLRADQAEAAAVNLVGVVRLPEVDRHACCEVLRSFLVEFRLKNGVYFMLFLSHLM